MISRSRSGPAGGGIGAWAAALLAVPLVLAACQDTPTGVDEPAPAAAGDVAPLATAGATEAPDLVSVGNFRPGPADDDGNPQTLVDFSFDQAAYVNGGDYSNFHLVPLDGGDPLDARAVAPAADTEGDAVVTVLFSGTVPASDYARGFVDTGIVNSACCNVGPDNPANINQASPISNGGRTENPDLVSVTRDGDQVLFEFDEPLTDDDVVQNSSGLRVYFPQTDQQGRIREAGALVVRRQSPTVLRAYYGDDLPEGFTLADAVGGFVTQGAVQAAQGSRGANDGVNAFDETAPIQDTGAQVCAAPAAAGGTGSGSGPTAAPDLTGVGNFRRGPFTDGFQPTTCVDFTFDQVAYLAGGNRSSFHLVPLDGGDALDGTSNQVPTAEQDPAGDQIVTVVFPGDLAPADFARGYLDSEIVTSREQGATSGDPLNVNQAADIRPNVRTENPDLALNVRSIRYAGEWLYFVFDEPLTRDDVIQNTSGLRVYFPEAREGSRIPHAGAVEVRRVSRRILRARFADLPAGYRLQDAVGAFVTQGTVQAVRGSRGGNDGVNAFDETVFRLGGWIGFSQSVSVSADTLP